VGCGGEVKPVPMLDCVTKLGADGSDDGVDVEGGEGVMIVVGGVGLILGGMDVDGGAGMDVDGARMDVGGGGEVVNVIKGDWLVVVIKGGVEVDD
jgi:hypothetical protein